jgi:hypothetical protein
VGVYHQQGIWQPNQQQGKLVGITAGPVVEHGFVSPITDQHGNDFKIVSGRPIFGHLLFISVIFIKVLLLSTYSARYSVLYPHHTVIFRGHDHPFDHVTASRNLTCQEKVGLPKDTFMIHGLT